VPSQLSRSDTALARQNGRREATCRVLFVHALAMRERAVVRARVDYGDAVCWR
jgi:hypothetical protein